MSDVMIEPAANGAPVVVAEPVRRDLDVIVIGSGPGGQRAAIQAAKLGKRVAVVERRERVGGVSIHTGTVPSKTLRQAILEDIANRGKDIPDPLHPELRERAAVEYLRDRTARVVAQETAIIREQFRRNSVGLIVGDAEFLDAHTIRITDKTAWGPASGDHHDLPGALDAGPPPPPRVPTTPDQIVTADNIVIAVGTRPARPKGVAFDDGRVIDSDGILRLEEAVPRTMTVVGAGVIGVEYASMFAAMGTRVTLVDARATLLPFIDREIAIALRYLLRRRNVAFRFGEEVVGVERDDGRVLTRLKSGKTIQSHTLMYATGRQGATEHLQLERAGLDLRQARAHRGRRGLPHVGAPHLRGGRRRRAARSGGDEHGAGTHRRAARVRSARVADARARPHRDLRDPGDLLRRRDGGGAHGGRGALRRRRGVVA